MSQDVLLTENRGAVRLLTFHRPDKMNAFDQALWCGLADALEAATDDPTVHCVVITGSGRAFTAGQDLGLLTGDDRLPDGEIPGFQRLMPVLEAFEKPLVAGVNGLGVGFGLTVLLHCDLALIGESARLKVPFMSLGVTTEASSSLLLPSLVGSQRAAEIIFTEPWIDAHQAVADGLALRVCPDDTLLEETMALADSIAQHALGPLVETKRLLLAGRLEATTQARRREDAAFERLVAAMISG